MTLRTCKQRLPTLAGLVLVLAVGCSQPSSPGVLTLAPSGMNPTGPYIADPSGGVAFWGNGGLQSKVYLEKGPVTITIRARGNTVDGEAPALLLDLEARVVGKVKIDSVFLKDYTVTTDVQHAGMTILGLSFGNYLAKPKPIDSRHVYIEMVTVNRPS